MTKLERKQKQIIEILVFTEMLNINSFLSNDAIMLISLLFLLLVLIPHIKLYSNINCVIAIEFAAYFQCIFFYAVRFAYVLSEEANNSWVR